MCVLADKKHTFVLADKKHMPSNDIRKLHANCSKIHTSATIIWTEKHMTAEGVVAATARNELA